MPDSRPDSKMSSTAATLRRPLGSTFGIPGIISMMLVVGLTSFTVNAQQPSAGADADLLEKPPATAVSDETDTIDADSEDDLGIVSALGQFTTAVEDREPIDQVTFVGTEVNKIFFFSDLRGLAGESVTHRWIFRSEVMAEVVFEVRGPRWRVWSSKDLLEDWIGDWTVEIVRSDGEVIAAETFTYSAPGN